jgi:hypothetical protein
MTWASRKSRINDSVRREFFDLGTYTPLAGAPVPDIQATIDKSVQRFGSESNVPLNHDEITFLKIDIPNAKRGDTFNDGTTTYTFVSVLVDDGAIPVWLVTA